MADVISLDSSVHKALAKSLFNHVSELLEIPNRTVEQDDEMLNASHASRFHWSKVGSAQQFSAGEWQISRVYGVLMRPEPCLHHAQKALDFASRGELEPFYFAHAHEAMARGHILAGSATAAQRHINQARSLSEIMQNGERTQLMRDLDQLERDMHARAE